MVTLLTFGDLIFLGGRVLFFVWVFGFGFWVFGCFFFSSFYLIETGSHYVVPVGLS